MLTAATPIAPLTASTTVSDASDTNNGPLPPSSPTRSLSITSSRSTRVSVKDVEADVPLTPQRSQALSNPISRQGTSLRTTMTSDLDFEIDWEGEDDPDNPKNWSVLYKAFAIFSMSWTTWVVVLYSTSYTSFILPLKSEFHLESDAVVTLGVTTYLIGLAIGNVILAPLSEVYGRKPVYVITMFCFFVMVLPTALATSLPTILVSRFVGALFGSAMIANAVGTLGDISNPEYRALYFSIWSIGPMNGPVFGPVIGGFTTQYLGWRWTNWLVMIFAAVGWGSLVLLKETYAPTLLIKKARIRRAETNDERWWTRYDQKMDLIPLLRINLWRPFKMAFTEPICIFWNFYIAIVYGILYLCFVAYPIVFTRIRGWTIAMTGLAFLGIGAGCTIIIVAEPLIRRMINAHKKDPTTGKVYPEATMSIVCIAAFLVPAGQFWFSFTCAPPTHWIWPILAGIPFGAGNGAVFIYASNYIVGSYGIYAASAMASNTVMRSAMGATLPLAGTAMYARLGPNWAGALLGFLQVAIIPIPLIFYRYGHKVREKSALISEMEADQRRLEGKRKRRSADAEALTKNKAAPKQELDEKKEFEI